MHAYSSDDVGRDRTRKLIAALSVGLAFVLGLIIQRVPELPWWIDVPSVVGFYGLLQWVVDSFAWEWGWYRGFGLAAIPSLAGEWHVELASSHDQHNVTHAGTLRVRQDFQRLSIELDMPGSVSSSFTAAVLVDRGTRPLLSYQYRNRPKSGARDTMTAHDGAAELTLTNENVLEGEYFTGRGRQNHGRLKATRRGD